MTTLLAATRAHLEWYRTAMEQRGIAVATIDRRLCTVCGYYRFAHLDGRIDSNPAQYVRRPKVQPSEERGMDRSKLARFLFGAEQYDHAHAALAVLVGLNGLRVSEACGTVIEALACEHGHRHMLRAAFIMAALDAGVPLREVQLAARHADPRTPPLTADARTSTATPPTSSSPSSPAGSPTEAPLTRRYEVPDVGRSVRRHHRPGPGGR